MKAMIDIFRNMIKLKWQSFLTLSPLFHDMNLLHSFANFESSNERNLEQARWLIALVCLRNYAYLISMIVLILIYWLAIDFLTLPLAQAFMNYDGQSNAWIFWLADRGLVGLLLGLSIGAGIVLVASLVLQKLLASKADIIAKLQLVVVVWLGLTAMILLRAGFASVLVCMAIFIGGYLAERILSYFFITKNFESQMRGFGLSLRNKGAMAAQSSSDRESLMRAENSTKRLSAMLNSVLRWRLVLDVFYVFLCCVFVFAFLSYVPLWTSWLLQSFGLQVDNAGLMSAERMLQLLLAILCFLILEAFVQMTFFHFYYQKLSNGFFKNQK